MGLKYEYTQATLATIVGKWLLFPVDLSNTCSPPALDTPHCKQRSFQTKKKIKGKKIILQQRQSDVTHA